MDLFTPVQLGDLQLRNRVIMAPMTRSRADTDAVPTPEMVEYYRQRSSAGLIITEGIAPSADGLGYCRTPGLYNKEQVVAWRSVVDAVHGESGLIAAQLMHVGRVANALNKPAGSETVAPSAIRAQGEIYTDQRGMQLLDHPRGLSTEEVGQVVAQYAQAAGNAFEAGFDAIELHCTSGYLPAQFLSTGSNQRGDRYGGSVTNRVRFVLEVLAALVAVNGAGRVGMRICPDNPFNDLHDEDPQETFDALLQEVSVHDLAYLHVIRFPGRVDNIALGRTHFAGKLVANESYDFEEANSLVGAGEVQAVSFGRPFIANPDLLKRWRSGADLATFDVATLYSPGQIGYTDYPALGA